MIFVPISGTELLKPEVGEDFLSEESDQVFPCYVNEVTLETLKKGADCQVEPYQEIRVWNFQLHPPASREGRGEPCNEASINPQRGRVREFSGR